MNLYRIEFNTSSSPFFVIEQDEIAALRRAIQVLKKNHSSSHALKIAIEKICNSGYHLVLGALDEKRKPKKPEQETTK